MTHPLTDAAARRHALIAERLSCDTCGDDTAQLRTIHHHGWTDDTIICRACFLGMTDKMEFTDFPLAREAAR